MEIAAIRISRRSLLDRHKPAPAAAAASLNNCGGKTLEKYLCQIREIYSKL
jgi:hypothetical protein